jgi:hypothetical protein
VDRGPYPVVHRLHWIAAEHWRAIDGDCAARGVDPLRLRPDRFCSLIWNWAIQRVEDPTQWTIEMERPFPTPGRVTRPSPLEIEQEAEGFAALYAQVNSGR